MQNVRRKSNRLPKVFSYELGYVGAIREKKIAELRIEVDRMP